MARPKKEVADLLARLPADVSFDDIQYHIYVREKVLKGLADAEAGRVRPQREVERRMRKWTRK